MQVSFLQGCVHPHHQHPSISLSAKRLPNVAPHMLSGRLAVFIIRLKTNKVRERPRDRNKDRDRDTERETERDIERERETETKRQTERERQRETENTIFLR